jgi:hypothetical protein
MLLKNLKRRFEQLSSPSMQQDSDRPQLWSFNSPMNSLQIQPNVSISVPQGGSPSFPSPFEDAPPIFSIVFSIILVTVFGVIAMAVFGFVQNAKQPVITREAQVLTKRQQVQSSSNRVDDFGRVNTSTFYYITFAFPNGDREEFSVNGRDWGLLIEGDRGMLHSQGTWFKGFDRQHSIR